MSYSNVPYLFSKTGSKERLAFAHVHCSVTEVSDAGLSLQTGHVDVRDGVEASVEPERVEE